MKSYKTRGIVLHTVRYGEKSVVAYLLTDTLGRQTYMVGGVGSGKSRSNKMALLQPMFPLSIEGLESPRTEMHRFREAVLDYPLQSMPFDVRKSTIAMFMAEVIYRLIKESEPNSPLFDFVWHSVEALDALEEGVANFHLWFMVGLSRFLGFFPGNEYREGSWFDIREGIYVATPPLHGVAMNQANAALFNRFVECDVSQLATIGLNRTSRVEFLNSMLIYFGYHLDAIHRVRSIEILREVF
jgi:DNA repair protein RecO (recombination protein O)